MVTDVLVLQAPFWPSPAPAQIKVTFGDRSAASWHIEYSGAAGRERTAAVRNTGDNALKTATFAVPRLPPAFRLVTEGPGDLTATFLRVLKTGFAG